MKEENKIVVFQLSALNCDTLTRHTAAKENYSDDVMIKSGGVVIYVKVM